MPKILNTKGAAAYLEVSINWIHKLVGKERLKAYIYNEVGELVPRPPGTKVQGGGLFFYESDLKKYKGPIEPAKGHRYTNEDKQEVYRLHSTGISNREISRQMGISFQTVNNWLKQKEEIAAYG